MFMIKLFSARVKLIKTIKMYIYVVYNWVSKNEVILEAMSINKEGWEVYGRERFKLRRGAWEETIINNCSLASISMNYFTELISEYFIQ